MRLLSWLAAGAMLASTSDVVPHCGGPEVSIQSPGQPCGAHGRRWVGECRAPATCEYVSRPDTSGQICTTSCQADGDCAKLGGAFRCVAASESEPERKLCVPRT